MAVICIIVLIGLPAAGKTTLSRRILKMFANDEKYIFKVYAFDDLFPGKYQEPDAYKISREMFYNLVSNDLEKLRDTQEKTIVILDDNMYYKSMRFKYFKLAKFHRVGFGQILVECDLDDSIARNEMRTLKVPLNVIRDMGENLQRPGGEKWESNSLIVGNIFEVSRDLLEEFFAVSFINIPPILCEESGSLDCDIQVSVKTKADLMLRSLVRDEIVKRKSMRDFESQCKYYVNKRKEIMQSLKTEDLQKFENDSDLKKHLMELLAD